MFWSMVGTSPLQSAQKTTFFDVRRPVVVAFFPPITEADFNDSGTNDALDDFQYYARRVWQPLRKAGVDFHEVYAHSFRIRLGTRTTTFRPVKVDVGYYFVAPGKKPRVEYGVMTDADLLQVANEYFSLAPK